MPDNLSEYIYAILGTAQLQRDGEFIWNEDDLVEKLVKLFKEQRAKESNAG